MSAPEEPEAGADQDKLFDTAELRLGLPPSSEQDKLFDTVEFRAIPPVDVDVGTAAITVDLEADDQDEAEDDEDDDGQGFFGSVSMRRLFSAQVVSSLGDWIGLVALLAVADRLVRGTALDTFGAGFVLMSRMVPGLFLAPAAGVLVDRIDRRKLMVACDVGRGLLMLTIPFITQLWTLLVVSLFLEVGQLLWVPAKEASVPNLVGGRYVQRANSMSLAAAYGTFPVGAAIFGGLAKVAALLGGISILSRLEVNQESLALFVDAATFFTSAYLVSRLDLPKGPADQRVRRPGLSDTWTELKVGVRFIVDDRLIRTVMVALGAALMGAGAVVSLGPIFVRELLAGGSAGFGLILFSMGLGAAFGALVANTAGNRIPPVLVFSASFTLAGAALFLAASTGSLAVGAFLVGLVGFFAAPGYSSGFTLMHQHTEDELRGRVFGALFTIIRLCMVVSLGLSPIMAGLIHRLVARLFEDTVVDLGPFAVNLAGVRITLWMAGLVIGGSGLWAGRRLAHIIKAERARMRRPALSAGVTPEDAVRFPDPPL